MVETIEGQGRLESIREPSKVWRVAYRFDITTTHKRKSGVAGVALVTRRESQGTVRALDDTPIPQGEYWLHADEGEILRLDNFDVWSTVPNP
jgi:hypothetical protein